MSDNPTEQVLNDLFRYIEVLETQNGAILQFLKDRGIVTDEQFAPYVEKAATASDVKWRAARVRMEHLFANVPEPKARVSENPTKELPKKEHSTGEASERDHPDAQAAGKEQTAAHVESGQQSASTSTPSDHNAPKPDRLAAKGKASSPVDGAGRKSSVKDNRATDTSGPMEEKIAFSDKDETQITEESKQGQQAAKKNMGDAPDKSKQPEIASTDSDKVKPEAPAEKDAA